MGGSWVSDLGDEIHSTPALGGGRSTRRCSSRSTASASSNLRSLHRLGFAPAKRELLKVEHPTRTARCSCRMSTRKDENDRIALLQGTLDLLILRTTCLARSTVRALHGPSSCNPKIRYWLITARSIRPFNASNRAAGSAPNGARLTTTERPVFTR